MGNSISDHNPTLSSDFRTNMLKRILFVKRIVNMVSTL